VIGGLRGTWMLTPEKGGTTIAVRSEFDTRVPVLHPLAARATIRSFRSFRSFRSSELPVVRAQMEDRAHPARPAP
jgi:hypothetical protein